MSLIIAQINPTIGDFTGNLEKMHSLARQAGPNDTVFFALGSISGYLQHMPDQDFLAQGMLALAELANQLPHITIVSAYWNDDGLPTIFISQQGQVRHIPQPRAMLEAQGRRIVLSLTPPDIPEPMEEDFFVYLQPLAFNLLPIRQTLPANYTFGWANLVGGQDTLIFQGCSQWLMPDGRELRAPDWQQGWVAHDQTSDEGILNLDPGERAHQALLLGITDYVQKNRFPSIILGLSGGVDSALVALLAVQALGPERVYALTMPSPYSSAATLRDAHTLAANLGISLHEIPIEPLMKEFNLALQPVMGNRPPGVEQENLQSRIRTIMLMTLANRHNHLLLATSNRSEAMVGYATLYGDMSGGLAPIADLYKTEIYALCEYLDPHNKIIPRDIITRVPSAELRPGQTDQDSLPPYPLLDMILQAVSEDALDTGYLLQQGVDKATIDKTIALMASSQFKRAQAPPRLNLRGAAMTLPLTGTRNYISALKFG